MRLTEFAKQQNGARRSRRDALETSTVQMALIAAHEELGFSEAALAEACDRIGSTAHDAALALVTGVERHIVSDNLDTRSVSTARREVDFETAKILLGHRKDSTAQLYAERDERKADEAVPRIG